MMIDKEKVDLVFREITIDKDSLNCDLEPLELFYQSRNNPKLNSDIGCLIKPLSSKLNDINMESNMDLYLSIEHVLMEIANYGNPDDIILDFIEEAEVSHSLQFEVFLKCFKICLMKFDKTNVHPLYWCLNTIIRQLNDATLPEDYKLEGKEKLILDSDNNVLIIRSLYCAVMDFVNTLLTELYPKNNEILSDDVTEYIFQFLLKLLGTPLAYIDLEGNETKNEFRVFSEQIIELSRNYHLDLIAYLDRVSNAKSDSSEQSAVDIEFTNISLGVLYYLIFCEEVSLDQQPQVYSHMFIFKHLIHISTVMLNYSHSLIQRKGLLLSFNAVNRIGTYELNLKYIDRDIHSDFIHSLPAIMVFSEVKENRQLALEVFKKYISILDSNGKYTVLMNAIRVNGNSGFVGFVVTIVKDIVAGYLSTDNKRDLKYFRGKRLYDFIKKFTYLHSGVTTDLVEASDAVISALNLLRFLFLKDLKNVSGIWDYVQKLEEDYLDVLEKGLALAVTHYKAKLTEVISSPAGAKVEVTVAGEVLPNLSRSQKSQLVHTALNTFDLITSLTTRVRECIALHKSSS